MQIVRFRDTQQNHRIGVADGEQIRPLVASVTALTAILESPNPATTATELIDSSAAPLRFGEVVLLAPIDQQEVWAAGVTYKRSMAARMEESESAATLYDKVYASARPELFFKATPSRVVGNGGALRIRQDSKWNVPEPELALVLNSRLKLVGFAVGNDMSSRDIEGENPLYLPQAKVYDACCGLGPGITLASDEIVPSKLEISLSVKRKQETVFAGKTSTAQMARSFDELIGWLGRDNTFSQGVILLTGTGIVPDADFTLHADDVVEITIEGLGTLFNPIVQG